MPAGRPPRYRTKAEFIKKCNEYFSTHTEHYITHLSDFLGFSSLNALYEMEKKPEFSEAVHWAKQKVQMFWEPKLASKASAYGASFWFRSQANWKDKTEVDVTSAGQQLASVPISIIYQEVKAEDEKLG
jgi:hypothetical protein